MTRLLPVLLLTGCAAVPSVEPFWTVGGGELPDPGIDEDSDEALEILWSGEADVQAGDRFEGFGRFEVMLLTDGSDLCLASYAIESVAPDESCDTCVWAFELRRQDVEFELDEDCDRAGVDRAFLESTTWSLGYHADVVYVDTGDGFVAAGSGWLYGEGSFGWEWEAGFEG